jgi:hypothetical protein
VFEHGVCHVGPLRDHAVWVPELRSPERRLRAAGSLVRDDSEQSSDSRCQKARWMCVRILAAPIAPELFKRTTLLQNRGRRECRVKALPMARQQTKKLAAVTTGSAKSSGIPCAMVLTLMARSPRGPGFLAPVVTWLVTTQLDLSVGRPGPHAFASAMTSFVRATSCALTSSRPSHPALHVRDDREAPLR